MIVLVFFGWFLGYILILSAGAMRDSRVFYKIGLVYLVVSAPVAFYVYLNLEYINRYKNEAVATAIIEGEYYYANKYFNTYYLYTVNGKKYKGAFSRFRNSYSALYDRGDTIAVTYDVETPEHSIPTFQQYWYLNKNKEEYWLKIKNGVGRVKK